MAQYGDLFVFERLDVYRVAKEALGVVIAQKARLRGLPGEIASQLERSAVSTVANIANIANIAEATGRVGTADRRSRWC